MKTILLAIVVLSSALGLQAGNQLASTRFGEVPLEQVSAKIHVNGDKVTIGTSRVLVSLRLGSPSSVLPDGSWLYSGYSAQIRHSGPTHGTLVVRFDNTLVSRMTLADAATVTTLRQAPRRPADHPLLAVR
jgi:hypothetical protein